MSPEEEQLYRFYGIAYGGDYGATGADYTGHAPGVGGGVGGGVPTPISRFTAVPTVGCGTEGRPTPNRTGG